MNVLLLQYTCKNINKRVSEANKAINKYLMEWSTLDMKAGFGSQGAENNIKAFYFNIHHDVQ